MASRLARAYGHFVRAMAARAHQNYLYPVDSQVYSPEGELLDHVCANDLYADPLGRYHELLDAAQRER